MNVRTALISSALLFAVFGWACEQKGPTSPSASVGTPGGPTSPSALCTPGGGSPDAGGGVIFGAKKCPDPPCKGDAATATYSVTITGDVLGQNNGDWTDGNGRGKVISGITSLTDLPFFTGPSDPWNGDGGVCFGEREEDDVIGNIHEYSGGMRGLFWFYAKTKEQTRARYLLKMFSFNSPVGDWRPSGMTEMTMSKWELSPVNDGQGVKSIMCLGEGPFVQGVTIKVERTDLNP